uniref:Uncharacterized protein n=1 Tax=Oryctolagus cuniculus TaxID=9986 RepID=A0A5F9DEK3_RABIT
MCWNLFFKKIYLWQLWLSLEFLLHKWDVKYVQITLESFDADKEHIADTAHPGRHTTEMLVISFAEGNLS